MFKLQSPSKYSPFDTVHLLRCFFHCSKQFLNLSILMSFSASAVFCFASSTSAKHSPLMTFFIQGNKQKKVTWSEIGWIGRVGHRVMLIFGQKLLNIQWRCACKSPIMTWANVLSLQKKFTEAEHSLSQQCQLVHDTNVFLEHSPNRGSLCYKGPALQKIIPFF